MPNWAKALLGTGCALALLIGAAGVVGYLYVNRHKDEWAAAGKQGREDGRTFAAGKTRADCLDESLRRLRECSGLTCEMRVQLFFSGCLDAAADSPKLCEGIPPGSEIIRTVRWSLAECERRGMKNSQPCSRMMQELQRYCDHTIHR